MEHYHTQILRIFLRGDGETDGPVADNANHIIDVVVVCLDHLEPHRILWPGDKVSLVPLLPIEGLEVHICLVHRVYRPFVWFVHIQKVAVVPSAISDIEGFRYASAKVKDCVHLAPPLGYLPRAHSASLRLHGIVVESIVNISHPEGRHLGRYPPRTSDRLSL